MHTSHRSSSNGSASVFGVQKFPDFDYQKRHALYSEEAIVDHDDARERPNPAVSSPQNGAAGNDRWLPKKKGQVSFRSPSPRARQKSLSEAFHTIKERRGSVTESTKEVVAALKAPVSPLLVFLCCCWFMTSIFSNASSKSILIAFRQPITLTLVQFAFVSLWCIVCSYLASVFPTIRTIVPPLRYSIRPPSRELIITTLPLTVFQVGGHMLNSDAMARIPVSLVHTIKGLSPLLTVIAYRMIYRVHYSVPTYVSLVPLTVGVVMACSANLSANFIGLVCAFGSTILFVTQNIVSKRLFNEAARAEAEGLSTAQAPQKPDKLNLLCYSSGLAFLLVFPIWVWTDGVKLVSDIAHDGAVHLTDRPDALDHGRLALEFIFNGTFHFAQSLLAFVLLGMVSTVTYSVASLIKRVFVITFAIIWFGSPMTRIQAFGIALTFIGLYLYDRTNDAARADRLARAKQARGEAPLLPMTGGPWSNEKSGYGNPMAGGNAGPMLTTPHDVSSRHRSPSPRLNTSPAPGEKKSDDDGYRTPSPNKNRADHWLAPGTKSESTWKVGDAGFQANGVAV